MLSRYRSPLHPQVQGQTNRYKIFNYLRQHPLRQFSSKQVAAAVGINRSSSHQHLHDLASSNYPIVFIPEGKKRHFFCYNPEPVKNRARS